MAFCSERGGRGNTIFANSNKSLADIVAHNVPEPNEL